MLFCTIRVHSVQTTTVFRDLWALKFMSESVGFPVDFVKMHQLQRMKTGMLKTFGKKKPDKRLPVTVEMLYNWYSIINWDNYDQAVMFTALVIAFFGLLRTSQFAAHNQKVKFSASDEHSFRALWLSNLDIVLNKKGNKIKYFKLKIRSSKIDVFKPTS